MGIEGEPPSDEQVSHIRDKVAEYIIQNGEAVFDPRDVQRLNDETAYVARFFMHMYDLPGVQEDNAVNMIINAFKWRKEQKVHDIKSDQLNQNLKDRGELFVHGRDNDGKLLMVFSVRMHIKGADSMDDLKKFFLYMLERLERETSGDQLTIVFDCASCGLRNMDMELIQYMIQVFKDYYPWSLNYILVYEMPWVLNAAWKIIKGWLPAGAVKKIKFLTKTNIDEYVAEDQRPPIWGGTDDWVYRWEEEEFSQDIFIPNGDMKVEEEDHNDPEDVRKKSVSFAEPKNTLASESFRSINGSGPLVIAGQSSNENLPLTSSSPPGLNLSPLLSITPTEEIVFELTESGDLTAKVQIQNISTKNVAFKIKTTSPEKFRVRPSMSNLQPGSDITIEISVASSHLPNTQGIATIGQIMSILIKEKFLFTATTLTNNFEGTLTHAQLSEAMKTLRPEAQYRLRCTYLSGKDVIKPNVGVRLPQDENKLQKQFDSLVRKVNLLTEANDMLQSNVDFLKRLLFIAIFLLLIIIVSPYFSSQLTSPEKLFREICQTSKSDSSSSLPVVSSEL